MNRRRGVAAVKNRQEKVQRMAQRGEQLQKDDIAHLEEQGIGVFNFRQRAAHLGHILPQNREIQLCPNRRGIDFPALTCCAIFQFRATVELGNVPKNFRLN